MRIQKGPILVMLLTAAITYEGLSHLFPDAPSAPKTTQLQAGTAVLPMTAVKAPMPYTTPTKMLTQPVMNPYEAPSMKKKHHHNHSEATSAQPMMEASTKSNPQPDMSLTAPLTQIELRRYVDFHLVPKVIILPKSEEAKVSGPMFSNKNPNASVSGTAKD